MEPNSRQPMKEDGAPGETGPGGMGIIANVLNVLGIGAVVWLLLFPEMTPAAVLACMLCPPLAIIVLAHSRGTVLLVKPDKESRDPQIAGAFFTTALALAIKAEFYYHRLDYGAGWPPVLVTAAILWYLTRRFAVGEREKSSSILLALPFSLFFAYGAIMQANDYFDTSKPDVYPARVVAKIKGGTQKTRRYYLEVTPWGEERSKDEAEVSQEVFDRINPGDPVAISVKHGALGIPWYYVSAQKR